ncbi:MAG: aldo/keto reductase [Deltaproteobacteria bacterium]|nr:aldo/keto reductase [Deltaproteobacteria bacterium]MDQ3297938.1 aldo/keto reductase [Myxococcota bacterium]
MRFAHGPDSLKLGDFVVRRLGYGAMRLPGKGVWGEPDDPATAHAVLRRAIEHGINFIDTAWYYGPYVANRLIVEALYPYPSDLVIATKLGARRPPDRSWVPALAPDELRAGIEDDLRTLKLEQLPVVHLRWFEQPDVTFAEALDVLVDIQAEGKLRHIALSNVTRAQLDAALARTPIACVQNMFNVAPHPASQSAAGGESPDDVLAACEQHGIPFLPFFPLAMGSLATGSGALEASAKRHNCSPAQLAIAWLLARSPVMLPIPGTSKIAHLDENVGALRVALDPSVVTELAPNR